MLGLHCRALPVATGVIVDRAAEYPVVIGATIHLDEWLSRLRGGHSFLKLQLRPRKDGSHRYQVRPYDATYAAVEVIC